MTAKIVELPRRSPKATEGIPLVPTIPRDTTSELLTRGQRANIDARAKRMATEFQARAVDYLTWRTSFECYIPSYGMVDGLVSKMLANATLDEALAYEELKAARLAREDVRRIYERLREFMAGDVG